MREGLQKLIKELLIKEKRVVIPNFGTFTSEPEPAFLERIQGGMLPPSEKISFFPDQEVQNPRLLQAFKERYDIPVPEIEEIISQNVGLFWKALKENDVIQFPEIGNVYVDYQNKIQFIQEKSHISGDYFGLPKLEIEKPAEVGQRAVVVDDRFQDGQVDFSNNKQKLTSKDYTTWALYGIALLAFLFAGGLVIQYFVLDPMESENIYRSSLNKEDNLRSKNDFEAPLDSLEEERSFTLDDSPTFEIFEDEEKKKAVKKSTIKSSSTASSKSSSAPKPKPRKVVKPRPKKTETVEFSKETDKVAAEKIVNAKPSNIARKAVVIINAFEDANKANKLIRDVNKKSYTTYSDTKGDLTRVGVEILYNSESDLSKQINSIKREWNKEAWLLFQ